MLRMTPSVSAEAARSYFREALSRGEYYTQQIGLAQEAVGRWGGRAAERLGLKGEVSQLAFERLCENQHPDTGEKLTVRNQPNRRPGYDFNFHVPKSVSTVLELTGDERIVEALRGTFGDGSPRSEGFILWQCQIAPQLAPRRSVGHSNPRVRVATHGIPQVFGTQ